MKYYISIILFIALNSIVLAQDKKFHFGASVQQSIAYISSEDFEGVENRTSKTVGGLTFEYFLKEKLSLGAELFYSPNGFSFDRNYQSSQCVNYQFRYNYLSVPLKIRYNLINMFEKRGHIFIKTGIAPSYLLRAKVKTTVYSENNEIIDKNEVIFNDNITKFDFAGLGEIGLSTKTSEKFVIYLSVMHKRSFNSFSTDEFFPDNQLKHNSFHIIWGLNFL